MATEVFKHGLGEPYKRKEDARFIHGEGNYVDDVQLKGMLYGDIVRSPYAHALIKSIDISEAMKVPGVLAVITGKDLDAAGLAWMPTLSADTEAVLALDRKPRILGSLVGRWCVFLVVDEALDGHNEGHCPFSLSLRPVPRLWATPKYMRSPRWPPLGGLFVASVTTTIVVGRSRRSSARRVECGRALSSRPRASCAR